MMANRMCLALLMLALCQQHGFAFCPSNTVLKVPTNQLTMYCPRMKKTERNNILLTSALPARAVSLTTGIIPYTKSLSAVTVAWSASFVVSA